MDSDHVHNIDHHHDSEGHEERDSYPVSRRSFLKAAGFTLAVATVGCERPSQNAVIPHKNLHPEATPGKASWYASTCGACSAGCGILVKNRDGRPVKIEGNPEHPVSMGGLCAVGQASVLELYDSQRLTQPLVKGNKSDWPALDAELRAAFEEASSSGKSIWLLTDTVNSPTELRAIASFKQKYPSLQHVAYDPLSVAALLDAHDDAFGKRAIPNYKFAEADVIVSFDADFLGTWISPVEFTHGYNAARTAKLDQKEMARHIQFESRLSMSGSNADERIVASPADAAIAIKYLHGNIRQRAGVAISAVEDPVALQPMIDKLAEELWSARGKSLVVCGTNNLSLQRLCLEINQLLENYGSTLDIETASLQKRGTDSGIAAFMSATENGEAAAVIISGVNPVYDLPLDIGVEKALSTLPVVVSCSAYNDETSMLSHYVCPSPHYLESWNDSEPKEGLFNIYQPMVQKLRDTRTLAESLFAWIGTDKDMHSIVRDTWNSDVKNGADGVFELFWRTSVQNGFVQRDSSAASPVTFKGLADASSLQLEQYAKGFTALLYPKVSMLDGAHSSNPWLQELPDPVTKLTWDNYLSLSPNDAKSSNVVVGDVVSISGKSGSPTIELPVHIQEGQADGVIALALGYGKEGTQRFKNIGPQWIHATESTGSSGMVGVRVNDLLLLNDGRMCYESSGWSIKKTGAHVDLAASQKYDFITNPELPGVSSTEARECVRETSFAAFVSNPADGAGRKEEHHSLWSGYDYNGHHWGMAIDLTVCTGCSGCVIGCQAENNIPVVGKDEVRRHRSLQWMRIDRYYQDTETGLQVSHQPMMCQQCDNAPCETVCPVLATVHSDEGLNQQVYNRCVGTRYCSNNCPYKVRRFNWFDYDHEDEMANMVLNPDVTVRERGVMEKCSFCVQRIQTAKMDAKAEGRDMNDGDVLPACVQSCPSNAIVFGDMNDPESKVAQLMNNPRHYHALDEVGTLPSVGYLTLVRNKGKKEA
jgi:Fe-S-cluster-containing dehydrogenase component